MSLVCTHSPVFFSVIVNWCVLFCLHSISSGGWISTFVLITSDQLVLQTIAPDSTNDLFMACFSSSEPCQQISWNTWFKAAPHSSHLRNRQPVYPSSWNNEMTMGTVYYPSVVTLGMGSSPCPPSFSHLTASDFLVLISFFVESTLNVLSVVAL